MKKLEILFIGLFSAWADGATTIMASHYPELTESNPRARAIAANSFLEVASILGGQAVILYGGEKIKANPKIVNILAVSVSIPAFYAAANNLAHVAVIEARSYPWKTCPFLYSGK